MLRRLVLPSPSRPLDAPGRSGGAFCGRGVGRLVNPTKIAVGEVAPLTVVCARFGMGVAVIGGFGSPVGVSLPA